MISFEIGEKFQDNVGRQGEKLQRPRLSLLAVINVQPSQRTCVSGIWAASQQKILQIPMATDISARGVGKHL
jgi:hypothetical protein